MRASLCFSVSAEKEASLRNSILVPTTGLEPVRCYSLEPESSASANSATWAFAGSLTAATLVRASKSISQPPCQAQADSCSAAFPVASVGGISPPDIRRRNEDAIVPGAETAPELAGGDACATKRGLLAFLDFRPRFLKFFRSRRRRIFRVPTPFLARAATGGCP